MALPQLTVKNTTYDYSMPVTPGRLHKSDPLQYAQQAKEDDHEKDEELTSTTAGSVYGNSDVSLSGFTTPLRSGHSRQSSISRCSTPPPCWADVEDSDDENESKGQNILKIAFKRCGHELHNALLHSSELAAVRTENERRGQSCKLETGTMIFVEPGCYDQVARFALAQQEPLRPFHVIISEQFLPLLAAKINSMPSNLGLRKYNVEPFSSEHDEQSMI